MKVDQHRWPAMIERGFPVNKKGCKRTYALIAVISMILIRGDAWAIEGFIPGIWESDDITGVPSNIVGSDGFPDACYVVGGTRAGPHPRCSLQLLVTGVRGIGTDFLGSLSAEKPVDMGQITEYSNVQSLYTGTTVTVFFRPGQVGDWTLEIARNGVTVGSVSSTGGNHPGAFGPFTTASIPDDTPRIEFTSSGDFYTWRVQSSVVGDYALQLRQRRSASCGDGSIELLNLPPTNDCDDGNEMSGDGCDFFCQVESPQDRQRNLPGGGCYPAGNSIDSTANFIPCWHCVGEPSDCNLCGDGVVDSTETCDVGGPEDGDNPQVCLACRALPGWTCTGAPSVCSATCGDGVRASGESCDDGDTLSADGCDGACQIELGWECRDVCSEEAIPPDPEDCPLSPPNSCGDPCHDADGRRSVQSLCSIVCGDGLLVGHQLVGACDDGGLEIGDGCDGACQIEPGFSCTGEPSDCSATCGDGIHAGVEACEDGNLTPGDGCDGACQVELGWECGVGDEGSFPCRDLCADGMIVDHTVQGACDDGGFGSLDGCDSDCQIELGWMCTGEPSDCNTTCGDGVRAGSESCDDGALEIGDGCDANCQTEPGWACKGGNPSSCSLQVALGCGFSGSFSIDPLGDVDFYRVEATPGTFAAVDIDAEEIGSPLDSTLGIFDSAGLEIGFSDDDRAPGEELSFDSYLEITVPADGIYGIAVTAFDDVDFAGVDVESSGSYDIINSCVTVLENSKGVPSLSGRLRPLLAALMIAVFLVAGRKYRAVGRECG